MRVWGKMSAGRGTPSVWPAPLLAGKGNMTCLKRGGANVLATGDADRFGLGLNLLMMPPAIPLASPAFPRIVADTGKRSGHLGNGPGCLPAPIASNNCWWTCKPSSRS